jgi:hypothetical protein
VGGGGGIAGNVYINGNVGIGALSSASNKLNIQSPVTKLNSYTNINYTYPTSSVLIRNTTNASTLAERSCLINFQKNGLSGSYWDQLAAINMGLTDGQGTSLDFQVAYANGTGQYNYINALTLQSISLTNSLIGINTSTPSNATLDVSGSLRVGSGNVGIINFGQTGNGGYRSAYINSTSTNLYILNQQPGAFQFGTNNVERMRIAADGKVGIGTTAPGYLLDVSGGGAHIQTTDPQLIIRTNRPVYNGSKAAIQFFTTEDTNPMGRIECVDQSTGNGVYQNDMIFYSGRNVTNIERMRILANGSIGIGTSTPTSILDVSGSMTVGGSNGTSEPFTSFTSKKYATTAIGFVNAFSITTTNNYGASYLEVIVIGTYSGVSEVCIKYELAIAPYSGGTNLVYVNNATVPSGNNLPKTSSIIIGAFELRQTTSGKVTTFAVYGPAVTNNYAVYVRYLAGGTAGNTGTITML